MPKKAMSVTLDEGNVLWLRARARVTPGNNVSDVLDRLISAARFGRAGTVSPSSSVVGMVDLADDPDLSQADAAVRAMFNEYLDGAMKVAEQAPGYNKATRKKTRG